eukprot:3076512-Karenia_brevis.AAC.1
MLLQFSSNTAHAFCGDSLFSCGGHALLFLLDATRSQPHSCPARIAHDLAEMVQYQPDLDVLGSPHTNLSVWVELITSRPTD